MEYVPRPEHDDPLASAFLTVSLSVRLNPTSAAGAHCARVFEALNQGDNPKKPNDPNHPDPPRLEGVLLPACAQIDDAVATVTATHATELIDVAEAFKALAPRLRWLHRTGLHGVVPDFADRHANAIVVGNGGLIASSRITVGATVMTPNTTYTNHSHPPEEVYLVLSDSEWRHRNDPWHQPGLGGFVHNPPGIIHAMRAKNHPLFAVWLLI